MSSQIEEISNQNEDLKGHNRALLKRKFFSSSESAKNYIKVKSLSLL